MTPRADDKPPQRIEVEHACGCVMEWVVIMVGITEEEFRKDKERTLCLFCQGKEDPPE